MTKADPYNDLKICHKAGLISPSGDVSPLCAKTPRKINLTRERWTTTAGFVTCKKCERLMKARSVDAGLGGSERQADKEPR